MPEKPGPPLARRDDIVEMLHGVAVADPYRWLEDEKAPDVKQFLGAHNAYTRRLLDGVSGRRELAARLNELSYLESVSTPRRRGTRYFFSRQHKDKEKDVYYWREGKTGEPKLLIDPNLMSDDGSVSVRDVSPSWDGKWVAYKVAENNADEATLYVMEVATGKISEIDRIEGAKYAHAAWEPKSKGFYYTRLPVDASIPVADRPGHAAVYFHELGGDPVGDRLVHERTGDPRVFIHPEISRDGRYLFIYKYFGWRRNDVLYKDLTRHEEWQPFAVDEDATFDAYSWKGKIYVKTNLGAPRYKLMVVDPQKPALADWKELVPEREDAVLDGFGVVGDRLALNYLENASSRIEIVDLSGKLVRKVALPGIGTVIGPIGDPFDDTAYYGYFSYTTPLTVYETSVKSGGSQVYFELEAPVDTEPYSVEQVWYRSKDGTKVSMFVIGKKDMPRDGSTPFVLRGYGGFNINQVPSFRATWFAWLERGGAIAVPNLRGGGEYGEAWHRDGMLAKKQNVFDDFIAAAEFLVAEGYTKPERLAIEGGSNGGLLVGAAMVQRPELFRAVICHVPLLDMVRYHKFGSGKTWISEYGSADDPEQFRYLHAYSPYHHVKQGTRYPALLMMTADSDDRVDPMHARKFLAAIRHATTSPHPTLLRVEDNAGHGGGDLIKKQVEAATDVYAFLIDQLGL
jgi:prolyl oligopeptidase